MQKNDGKIRSGQTVGNDYREDTQKEDCIIQLNFLK